MHLVSMRAGLAHWGQHNRAMDQQRIQLAQANRDATNTISTGFDEADGAGIVKSSPLFEQQSQIGVKPYTQLAKADSQTMTDTGQSARINNFGVGFDGGAHDKSSRGSRSPYKQFAQVEGEDKWDAGINPTLAANPDQFINIDESQFTQQDRDRAKEIARSIVAGKVGVWDWNIGNMRPNGDPWAGAGTPYNNYETAFTPEYGVRMNARNLFSHGNTLIGRNEPFDIRHVANLWASGPTDDPAAWSRGVSYWSGIPENAIIDPTNERQVSAIMFGVMMQEKRWATVGMSVIQEGVKMAMDRNYSVSSPEKIRQSFIAAGFQSYGTDALWPLIYKAINERLREEASESQKDDRRQIDRP